MAEKNDVKQKVGGNPFFDVDSVLNIISSIVSIALFGLLIYGSYVDIQSQVTDWWNIFLPNYRAIVGYVICFILGTFAIRWYYRDYDNVRDYALITHPVLEAISDALAKSDKEGKKDSATVERVKGMLEGLFSRLKESLGLNKPTTFFQRLYDKFTFGNVRRSLMKAALVMSLVTFMGVVISGGEFLAIEKLRQSYKRENQEYSGSGPHRLESNSVVGQERVVKGNTNPPTKSGEVGNSGKESKQRKRFTYFTQFK